MERHPGRFDPFRSRLIHNFQEGKWHNVKVNVRAWLATGLLAITVTFVVVAAVTLMTGFSLPGADPASPLRCSSVMFPNVNEDAAWACSVARDDIARWAWPVFVLAWVASVALLNRAANWHQQRMRYTEPETVPLHLLMEEG